MKQRKRCPHRRAGVCAAAAALLLGSGTAGAQALDAGGWSAGASASPAVPSAASAPVVSAAPSADAAGMSALRDEIARRVAELDALKRRLTQAQDDFARLSHALDRQALEAQRGAGPDAPAAAQQAQQAVPASSPQPQQPQQSQQPQAPAAPVAAAAQQEPVGQAPAPDTRPPAVAPIFEQPGVLTPRGKFVLEPSLQYGYSSADRVALVGYTIVPALLIGLIDVQAVKTTTLTSAIALRYGLTNRMELEVRVP